MRSVRRSSAKHADLPSVNISLAKPSNFFLMSPTCSPFELSTLNSALHPENGQGQAPFFLILKIVSLAASRTFRRGRQMKHGIVACRTGCFLDFRLSAFEGRGERSKRRRKHSHYHYLSNVLAIGVGLHLLLEAGATRWESKRTLVLQ